MGGLFSSPKSVKAPPLPPPIATPEVSEEVGEQARKKRPRGRQKTFLTGELTPEQPGKKRTLG